MRVHTPKHAGRICRERSISKPGYCHTRGISAGKLCIDDGCHGPNGKHRDTSHNPDVLITQRNGADKYVPAGSARANGNRTGRSASAQNGHLARHHRHRLDDSQRGR
ncbi:hypothetical protein GCM10007901_28220 [Dyella acidisoli]|uniref:Uncharacterized protein n=1 Tax=Dyella acidisoli TaxID=1867834 RepID=A0ABQ5XRH2_9GAMM|nr:hypothetical protein GCM10007901_28220 [Dyella acidisoli]